MYHTYIYISISVPILAQTNIYGACYSYYSTPIDPLALSAMTSHCITPSMIELKKDDEDEPAVRFPLHCIGDCGGTPYVPTGPLEHVHDLTCAFSPACYGPSHLARLAPCAAEEKEDEVVWASGPLAALHDTDGPELTFLDVFSCLEVLDGMLCELVSKYATRPVIISLCDLIPKDRIQRDTLTEPIVESITCVQDECANLVAKCNTFVAGMREFIAEGYSESESLMCESYMSAGFFESCLAVHFTILEDFEGFFEPTLISDCDFIKYGESCFVDT